MTTDTRVACAEIFRTVEIVAEDRARFAGTVLRHDPGTLLCLVQARLYADFHARIRPVEPAMPSGDLLDALVGANARRTAPGGGVADLPHTYTALGPHPPTGTHWLRFYWNVGPRGAVALMAAATESLHRLGVPFRLKAMLDTGHRRRDAAVLYLPAACWRAGAEMIAIANDAIAAAADLESGTPLFARRLAPGIGLAEDPGTGASFGMHRTWIVARALATSFLRGHMDEQGRWDDLAEEFAAAGLSLASPHLNAPRPDPYLM